MARPDVTRAPYAAASARCHDAPSSASAIALGCWCERTPATAHWNWAAPRPAAGKRHPQTGGARCFERSCGPTADADLLRLLVEAAPARCSAAGPQEPRPWGHGKSAVCAFLFRQQRAPALGAALRLNLKATYPVPLRTAYLKLLKPPNSESIRWARGHANAPISAAPYLIVCSCVWSLAPPLPATI